MSTISVTPGYLGAKTDRSNLLTYSISGTTMSTITEKVNGVTVGTKNATSGQSLTVVLTQAQWDGVRFGKYAEIPKIPLSLTSSDWQQGFYAGDVGGQSTFTSNSTRIAMINSVNALPNTNYNVNINAPYELYVQELDANDLVVTNGVNRKNGDILKTSANTAKVKISMRKSDNSAITPSEAVTANPSINGEPLNNTLEISMGTEKWTYTFKKMPAANTDLISAAKVHKDHAEVVDPARRAKMASAIRSKGGIALDTDAWETMAQAVEGIPLGKKFASGTSTSGTTAINVTMDNSSSTSRYQLSLSGLSFVPGTIIAYALSEASQPQNEICVYQKEYTSTYGNPDSVFTQVQSGSTGFFIKADSFYFKDPSTVAIGGVLNLPVSRQGIVYGWKAFE